MGDFDRGIFFADRRVLRRLRGADGEAGGGPVLCRRGGFRIARAGQQGDGGTQKGRNTIEQCCRKSIATMIVVAAARKYAKRKKIVSS